MIREGSYPEHEKLAALRIDPNDPFSGKNQLVGDFIEWLRGEGIELARWWRVCHTDACGGRFVAPEAEECPECGTTEARSLGRPRLFTVHDSRDALIGRFFDIDPTKLAAEKDAMLAAIRAGR